MATSTFDLASPFEDAHPEKSHPATRADDKRLTRPLPQGMIDAQWVAGGPSPNPGGRPKTKLLVEDLTKKLEEVADKNGITFRAAVIECLVRGALGKKKISPSQMAAIQLIFAYTCGKPAMHEEQESGRPMVVFDIDYAVFNPR